MALNLKDDLYESRFYKTFLNTDIPEPLYHYTKKQTADIIENSKKFRFTKFDNSNDNLEFKYGLSLIQKILRNEFKQDRLIKAIFEKYLIFITSETVDPKLIFMMACFSRSKKSRHLWWNYADQQRGRCLQIEFDQAEVDKLEHIVCRDVIYSVVRFRKLALRLVREYTKVVHENFHEWRIDGSYEANMGHLMLSLHRDFFILSSFFKRRKYRSEVEYRIARWIQPSSTSIIVQDGRQFVYSDVRNSLKKSIQY